MQNTTLETIVNKDIIKSNLGYIENIANNQETKNNLVQLSFFDYLNNKASYKLVMQDLNFTDLSNKEIAKFYFNEQIKAVAKELFNLYGVELKITDKGYQLINSKKTILGDNIIKGAKEMLRNNNTLEQFLSINNLKVRIKLIDFRVLKEIVTYLNLENEKGNTLKALINNLDLDLNDIEYKKALKARIKEVKEHNKEDKKELNFDISKLNLADIETLIEQLKAQKELLNNPIKVDEEVTKDETSSKEELFIISDEE